MSDDNQYWGYHLMLDCAGCDLSAIKNPTTIANFSKNLVSKIGMIAYGEPQIVRFGSGDKEGYTLVQLIETSNICCHFVESSKTMYLDVHSCMVYDTNIVENLVYLYFSPSSVKRNFIKRQA